MRIHVLTGKYKGFPLHLAIIAILLAGVLSQELILQQAFAPPGRIGGGGPKIHESFRDFSRDTSHSQFRDTATQYHEQREPFREENAEIKGQGESFGFPQGSTLLKYVSDPKFGTKSSDALLLEHFLLKGGLELIKSRPEFVESVLIESNKLSVEEPLVSLESFINANLLAYLSPFMKGSILNYYMVY